MPWDHVGGARQMVYEKLLAARSVAYAHGLAAVCAEDDFQRVAQLWTHPELLQQTFGCCGFAAVVMALLAHSKTLPPVGLDPLEDSPFMRLWRFVFGAEVYSPTYKRPRVEVSRTGVKTRIWSPEFDLAKRVGWRLKTRDWLKAPGPPETPRGSLLDLALCIGLMLMFKFHLKWNPNAPTLERGGVTLAGKGIWDSFLAFSRLLVAGYEVENKDATEQYKHNPARHFVGPANLKKGDIGLSTSGMVLLCDFVRSLFALDWRLQPADFRPSGYTARTPPVDPEYVRPAGAPGERPLVMLPVQAPAAGAGAYPVNAFPDPAPHPAPGAAVWENIYRRVWECYEYRPLGGIPRGLILGLAGYDPAPAGLLRQVGGHRDLAHWVYLPPAAANPADPTAARTLSVHTWGREWTLQQLLETRHYVPVWGLFLKSP